MNVRCTPTVIRMLDAPTPLEATSVNVEMAFKAMDSFVEVDHNEKSLTNFKYLLHSLDIDECDTGLHNCHVNATCNNTSGSHTCTCNNKLFGNGTHCNGIAISS